jgi:hypothetical protein
LDHAGLRTSVMSSVLRELTMGGSEPDGEAYGRDLAERIIVQARRYGLGSRDMAVMFVQDVDRRVLTMQANGVSAEEIAQWSRGVTIGCRLRIDEEASAKGRSA